MQKHARSIITLLLLLHALIAVHSIKLKSLTADECGFYTYGRQLLFHGRVDRWNSQLNSKLPFLLLHAIPERLITLPGAQLESLKQHFEQLGVRMEQNAEYGYVHAGRIITILASLLLGILVFRWSRELYGISAALFSLGLYVFSPNILAHARLVTSDLFATLAFFATSYSFWRYRCNPSPGRLYTAAAVFSLGQLTKYSLVYLGPLLLMLSLAPRPSLPERSRPHPSFQPKRWHTLLVFGIVFFLFVNSAFLWKNSFYRLGNKDMQSSMFAAVADTIPDLIVPLPYEYVNGMDWVKAMDTQGCSMNYLHGKTSGTQFYHYYVVAFLLKVPLAFLPLLLLRLFNGPRVRIRHEIHLLAPVLFCFIYFNLLFKTQIGFRYLLPVMPYLFVLTGALAAGSHRINPILHRVLILVLLGWFCLSSLSYHPHYLSHFNELIGSRTNMYRWLIDSNNEWGQNRYYLERYLRDNPETVTAPSPPRRGKFVIDVNTLVGAVVTPEYYRWLRDAYEPIGHIAYGYLVYEFSREPPEWREAEAERIRRESLPAPDTLIPEPGYQSQ